jgi:hypothetical protein
MAAMGFGGFGTTKVSMSCNYLERRRNFVYLMPFVFLPLEHQSRWKSDGDGRD